MYETGKACTAPSFQSNTLFGNTKNYPLMWYVHLPGCRCARNSCLACGREQRSLPFTEKLASLPFNRRIFRVVG